MVGLPLQADSLLALLEQRLRDVESGVRIEAVAAAAAASRVRSEAGMQGSPHALVNILLASLRDSDDSVRLAGIKVRLAHLWFCAEGMLEG